MRHELVKLFRMTGGGRRFIVLLILRCPFDAVWVIVQAGFLKRGFDAINHGSERELYTACAMFALGNIFLFLYNGTVWTMYTGYVAGWIGKIRRKLFEHMSGLSLFQIEAKSSGEWFTRLNSDVQSASAMLNEAIHLPHAVTATVKIIVSIGFLISVNTKIFGLVVLFLIPHLLVNKLYIEKPMTSLSTAVQVASAKNTADMNAIINCAETAILYDAQGFLLSCFEESSMEMINANMKIRKRGAMTSGLWVLAGLGYLAILLVAGILISERRMTFSELTAAFQYRGGVISGSMMAVNSIMNMKVALSGVKRVNETMQIRMEE